MYRRRSGFTIVELLIVIVIIAILAAVVIVAYNGVQARAANSTIYSAVKTWAQALQTVKETNGSYPSISDNFVCLSSSLPADGSYDANQCAYDDSGWSVTVNGSFNSAVSSVVGGLPQTVMPKIDGSYYSGYDHVRGVMYYDTIDGHPNEKGILYDMNGTDCGNGGTLNYSYEHGNVQCRYVLH